MLGRIWRKVVRGAAAVRHAGASKDYVVRLPAGYPAGQIAVRLSVPALPKTGVFHFADHALDESGRPTDTVLATGTGQFAISRDLGRSWKRVALKGREDHEIVHLKSIGESKFLAQAARSGETAKSSALDVLVLNDKGDILAAKAGVGCRWHGCRSAGRSNGTLMYAEYPSNKPVKGRRPSSSRVLRSRDEGRSWEVVFERTGDQVRHFHFLQPRPGVAHEWWLTSGDAPQESRVWVSKDDGEHWQDLTESIARQFDIGGERYARDVFRLTDLAWEGNEIVWGTDDTLSAGQTPGAALFRSAIGPSLKPQLIGRCAWHIRNIVEVGDFYLAISQGCPHPAGAPDKEKPGVYLLPRKAPASGLGSIHLFDIDTPPGSRTKFSASRASRAAKDGTFFTFRANADVFPSRHRILEWNVTFS